MLSFSSVGNLSGWHALSSSPGGVSISTGPQPPLKLRDGRELAWHESGDPKGRPCIYITGAPAAGVAGRLYHAAALKAGVRWLSVDKPGYGRSSASKRSRRLLDWPGDIVVLADHLQLSQFAVAGESGGGPYALALAHDLPQRVTAALLMAGLGPWDENLMRSGMDPRHYRWWDLARTDPALMASELQSILAALDDPVRREVLLRGLIAAAPSGDRRVYETFPEVTQVSVEAYQGALRGGSDAAIAEMCMLTQPWGFDPSLIKVPVILFHGTADKNIPVESAQEVARLIPGCRALFVRGAGHCLYEHAFTMIAAQ